MHDLVALEARGIPTAAFRTTPFAEEEAAQAAALGMPDYRMLALPHPIQPLPIAHVAALAETVVEQLVAALTVGPSRGSENAKVRIR